MQFIQRLGYYLGGLAIGLIILAFFLSGKKTSCDYFPEARVLKNIRIKSHLYAADAKMTLEQMQLDTATINGLFKYGDVNFGESQTRKKPCGLFVIEGEIKSGKNLQVTVENCDSIATITKIKALRE